MMQPKKPEVHLIGKPTDPYLAVGLGSPSDEKSLKNWIIEQAEDATKYPLFPHPLDRFRLSFILFNVSRAFQQQLTRHRLDFSYSIQSLRMVNVGNFYEDGAFTVPEFEVWNYKAEERFYDDMEDIENEYSILLDEKLSVQDARGILPLNIHSTVTFSCTFRALRDMLGQRLCLATQGEFRDVANQIKTLINEWDSFWGNMLVCPCDMTGICFMNNETCKKVETGKTKLKV
jgi:thymidylate synthase ThyX